MVTDKSTAFNQENIRFHQQQHKVSGIEKDLDYRDSQEQNLSSRIQKNSTELEQVKTSISETLQHVDHSDEDLLAMYAYKEELAKGVEEAEQEYYASRGRSDERRVGKEGSMRLASYT